MSYTACTSSSTRRFSTVDRQCREIGYSFEAVVNAAWAIALWSYLGEDDFDDELHNNHAEHAKLHEETADSTEAAARSAHPVRLVCNTSTENLDSSVHFDQQAVDQQSAEGLSAAFTHILDLVMSSPDSTLDSVNLVSEHDTAQMWAWNNVQAPETVNSCAHTLFHRQVMARPTALAVDAWDGSFTYEELDRSSTRIAHYLVLQGVGPESVVPLCFDKSRWAINALLAVIKAGGAMVFIDPANPASRRQEIMRQLNKTNDSVDFILTDACNASSWEAIGVRPIIVDETLVKRQREYGAVPRTGVSPTSLLYVIFTSGSTGTPKGCLITHNAFLSGALQHAAGSNLGPESRVMQLASYSFDVSVLEILTSLISGACVCTPSSAAMTQSLASIVNDYRITWAFLTPSLVKLIQPHEVPTLKTLILGGELLHAADIKTWADRVQLINGYGPSECSIAAAGAVLNVNSDPADIGRALGGLGWVVQADDHDKLVPIGAVGELLISGPILARGYLNNAEKTAEVFIDNPAWLNGCSGPAADFNRFYKTGDLAKFNPDGTIHFIGRKDTQVKLRGLRIELGEIEHNIGRHSHVKHVAVYMPKNGPCKDKLVAVTSLNGLSEEAQPGDTSRPIEMLINPTSKEQLNAVQAHLAGCVPEYMVPAVWIAVEAWPLLTSAKLDRKSVQRWLVDMDLDMYRRAIGVETSKRTQDDDTIRDVAAIEAKLTDIFGRILNISVDLVPRDKSFLGLGGDSIAAMQVMSQCRAVGLSITVKDIMRCKDISELARTAVQLTQSSNASITEEVFDQPFQLSPVQCMYAARLRPDYEEMTEVHFNQSFYLRLANQTPRAVLKAGLDAVVTRHSMLRARFMRAQDGTWTQKVLQRADGSYRFKCHSLESIDEASTAATISQRTLGLAGPVFSADLLEVGDEQLLFMVAHHAIIDWVSWRIILRDLEEFLATGTLAGTPPLPFQNWINLQAEHEAKRAHPEKSLPFEVPSPDFAYWNMEDKPNTVARAKEQVFRLDAESTAALLGDLPHKALRTETLDFLLTSLLYSFGQVFTDRQLPAIFREGHGREPWDSALDVSGTVGWFTTMYPLAVAANEDLVAMLKNVKDARHSIPDNGRAYFASRFHNERAAELFREHDLIEISFDYLGQFQTLERSDAILRREPRPSFLAQSDDVGRNLERLSLVEITVEILDGEMQYSFIYNKQMQFQDRIQAWIDGTKQTLHSLIAQMTTVPRSFTLADFPHLSTNYSGLDTLLKHRLPEAGVSDFDVIEEVSACSPMQQGLLVSQNLANQSLYEYCHVMEVKAVGLNPIIDAERYAHAWSEVVQRHSALRTMFIQSVSEDGLFDQVVLKAVESNTVVTECLEENVYDVFAAQKAVALTDRRPPHRLTICRVAADRLICQLQINHAIIDGGSIANLVRDFVQAYNGSLPEQLSFTYSDYIGYIQSRDTEEDLGFWKNYLGGQTPCLIPNLAELEELAKAENKIQSFDIEITPSLATLKEFCERSNITLVNLFQVAWGMVLRTFTDSPDVCFGYLSSGRDAPLPGIEDGVGAFLTMLVCRLDLDDGVTLSDALQRAAEDFANSMPRQHCGLASIQHALGVGRDPLFNTILSFNRYDLLDTQSNVQDEKDETSIEINSISTQDPTEYPLSLEIGILSNGLTAAMQHWTDHLTPAQARSIASTFDKALCTIVDHPELRVKESELVHQDHLNKFLEFNGNGQPIPVSDRLMFESIEENARTQPHKEAICSWDGSWTYKELNDAATRLAHHLRTLGVAPETVVPYCFNKSAWAAITMLAISKAGGAFVGLDPTNPQNRLQELVAELESSIVCVSPENAVLFHNMPQIRDLIVIEPDFVNNLPTKSGDACPELQVNNLACIILTSGTTGRPKTIAIEHSSMSTMSDLLGPRLKMDSNSRVFQFAAYTYDISTHDIFVTLQRGGCVCMPSEQERTQDIAGAMSRLGANWVSMTNTVLSLLRPEDVPSLKFIITGGEPVSRSTVQTWVGAGVEMVIGCGPAETTITMSVSAPLHTGSHHRNIGPSYGGRAWIVDSNDHNKLVPLGAAGEVLLEGPQLARCYLGNPEKTAESFIWNPKWAQNMTPGVERRFYKSGDICRYNMDGSLSIVGRKDTQCKINGRRVELEEISHKIRAYLGSSVAVVLDAMPLQTSSKGLHLVAFLHYTSSTTVQDESIIIPASEELIQNHSELESSLLSSLPRYMIPNMYVPVSRIPRTPNGKLDTKRLREAVLGLTDDEVSQYSLLDGVKKAPSSETEKGLQLLWASVLSRPLETIGANDDFFRLGGDSVSAIRLVAAARAHDMALNVSSIFKFPKLEEMAVSIDSANQEEADVDQEPFNLLESSTLESARMEAAELCGVESQTIVDLYPCTPLQEGLMAISTRLGGGSYKAQSVFRLPANFDTINFKSAWQAVAAQEPILRTRIVHVTGHGSLQAVLDQGLEWIEVEDGLDSYLSKDLEIPTTYGSPLLRLALVKAAEDCYFVWSAHHAVYDAWSAAITLEQVKSVLRGGEVLPSVPYKAFIRHIQSASSNEISKEAFWESQFPEGKEAPTSLPLVATGYSPSSHETVRSGRSIAIPTQGGITMSTVLRAAWALTVARYTDSDDIVFAVTLSGRTVPVDGISTMNGPTMTTVPVRVGLDLADDSTVQQFLKAMQAQATDMMPFEQTGLQNIRKINSTARNVVDSLGNLLVLQPASSSTDEVFEGTQLVPRNLEKFGGYPLVVLCHMEDGGKVTIEAKHDASIIDTEQMRRMVHQYEFVLEQLSRKPSAPLSQIHGETSHEDVNEIVRWNGTMPENIEACIHDIVAARATEYPNAQAVCAWDGDFTYQELEHLSNKLATHLKQLGVGPEIKVGICLEKSKWHVVAMLSVLKAGGVYTNLNPSYPSATMQNILDDLEAITVLSSSQYASLFSSPTALILDSGFLAALPEPAAPVSSEARPTNAAFIVFTSGSTGKPKGVTVEHQGFSSMQHYQAPQLGIGNATRTLQFAAHWFDISNFDTFVTLMQGGCVCIASDEERLNDLAGAINKYQVNWATMVPTAAAVLQPDDIPGLKHLSLGGEPIRPDLHARFSNRVVLMNSYGPAECSVLTTMGSLRPETSPQNIGVGMGCRTWVTDKDNSDRLVPIGSIGELCIDGPILSRGYHKEDGLTAHAYISNPGFVECLKTASPSSKSFDQMRLYKTGDLVRYSSDGTLIYVGRKDSQVKVHGRRIELGEIEHHVVSHGFSNDRVVVEKILEGGDAEKPALAVFVRFAKECSTSSSLLVTNTEKDEQQALINLRRGLSNSLPPFMVPSLFVALQRMPVTQTGKKDRKALRQLGAQLTPSQLQEFHILDDESDSENQQCGFSTNSELQLQALWAGVLDIPADSIKPSDHFLQKGGDSVRAISLVAAVRRELGKTLTVGDIFAHPRLNKMAMCLDSEPTPDMTSTTQVATKSINEDIAPFALVSDDDGDYSDVLDHAAQECNVQTEEIEDVYPCTPLQAGMMAVSTYEPEAYVAKRVFNIPDDIDLELFKQAWIKAIESIPILRTRIVPSPEFGTWLQVILKKETPTFHEIRGSVKTYLSQQKESWRVDYGRPLTTYGIAPRSRRFVWAIHHALYDGSTAGKLLEAVQGLYNGVALPSSPAPAFNRFIAHLNSVDSAVSAQFWRQSLGASGSPATFPRLPSAGYRPRPDSEFKFSFDMTHDATTGILKTTILRAAWAFVTARYMESDDIVFGETLSGRNSSVAGIEDMMGPCITTIPMRAKLDGHLTVGQYLSQMQTHYTAMMPFQHAGLQAIRAIGPEVRSSLDFNNLFEVVVPETMGQTDAEFIHEIEHPQLLEGFFDSYAVVMECVLRNSNVSLEIRFDQNVLSAWHVERLCGHFKQVVRQLSSLSSETDQAKSLDSVDMTSPEDLALIRSWNSNSATDCVNSTVHKIFAEQVRLRPRELAITGWDGDLTYEQLDNLSTTLAKTLVSRWGVKSNDIIPLCFEKSKWAIVAAMAVVKAGGAVTQLGVTHPLSRKMEVLQQTSAKFVITSPKQASIFRTSDTMTPLLLVDDQRIQHMQLTQQVERATISLPQVSPRDPVYVLFTSGSTGRSKGIVVEHGNLCTSSSAHGAGFNINAGTRVFQFAAYTFDVSCADIFTSLQRGATICVPSEEERVDDLAGAITKYNANWMFATPTVAQLIAPELVPTLRTLVLGGEAPTKDNVETWAGRDDLSLLFCWGPAETTIYASTTPPITLESAPGRLGQAMGCKMWLCDPSDHNKLTPIGCVGEIVVEGGIVSREYLGDEAKTSAAYIQDPDWVQYAAYDGISTHQRMYKTGDLARYDSDGIMRYVGRKDNQVKLQGQRIELGEVEHRLRAHSSVYRALARVPRAGPLKDKLVAILSFNATVSEQEREQSSSSQLTPLGDAARQRMNVEFEDIRQTLARALPSYMVPSIYIAVEAIPLSGNGKVDAKQSELWLQEMDQALYETLMNTMLGAQESSQQHASTPEEAIVLSLVSQVLNMPDGSARLNLSFLSQGGDSITAMQLRSKARAEGLNLTMQDILKSQSLSALASVSKSTNTATQTNEDTPHIVMRPEEPASNSFALSPIQQLFFDTAARSSSPTSHHFNQSFMFKLSKKFTAQEMRVALEALVARHAMLRTKFTQTSDGQWSQSITDRAIHESFSFTADQTHDTSEVSQILLTRGGNHGMGSIQDGPLFLAHLFDVGKESSEQLIFLSAHHLVVDLVSWRIILSDLQDLLTKGSMTPSASTSFQAWLRLQQEYASTLNTKSVLPYSEVPAAQLDYWGMDATSANTFGQMIETEFLLDEAVTTKLFGSSNQAFKIEPVDIILAAIMTAFGSVFTDRTMPPIFAEGHGRESWDDSVDPNGIVGWFTTMSPVHIAAPSVDLVENVRKTKDTRRRIPRNGMPYFSSRFFNKDCQEQFGKDAGPVEILFNYVGKYQQLETKDALFTEADQDIWRSAAKVGADVTRFSLIDISVGVANGKTRVAFGHNKNLLHQEKIGSWISTTQDILTRGAEALNEMSGSQTIGDFPLMLRHLDTEQLLAVEENLSNAAIPMNNVHDMYPCTPMQQHILAAQEQQRQQPNGRQHVYEVDVSHRLLSRSTKSSISPEKLQAAWQHVVNKHSILRTIFVATAAASGRPASHFQVVLSSYKAQVPIIKCDNETELLRLVKSHKSVEYQTLEKPHHSFTLFSTNDGRSVMCKLEISHALNDGMSTGILFRDLEAAYRGSSKALANVPHADGSFGDYMTWLEDQRTEQAADYWRKLLVEVTGSTTATLPKSSELGRLQQAPTQKSLEINLNPTLMAALPSFCRDHGITPATFFQAVWGLVLQTQSQSPRIKEGRKMATAATPFFGYMTANRDSVDGSEEMVGPLTNMLMCRADVQPNMRIGELLRRRQGEFLEALPHQFGLDQAVEELMEKMEGEEGKLGRLCNSVMSLQYIDADGGHIPQSADSRHPAGRTVGPMTRSRCVSESIPRPLPSEHARLANSGRKARHVSWGGPNRLPLSEKANIEDDSITFRPLAYRDPNDYDISLGVQIMKSGGAGLANSRNTIHAKAQFVYWTDAVTETKANMLKRAFEKCAEELISDATGCLRVWMLLRRVALSI
ncbi:uncharacterized protein JN550_010590 [Neoarthrinium moseri]|uniref:uncharacterized protein n=1 Tax=Neoarthrinium moseri TaxID=1658444 RepID=UPI001FDBF179|nr:uncharacterized protein JN550_010590 [Neoarthrinium moseri]KAI1861959.1 hypothetical protein JN550_010590 [Neoarthrinium moseri]